MTAQRQKTKFNSLRKWRVIKDEGIKKKKHFDFVSFLIFILSMFCLFGLLKFFGLRLLTGEL